MPMAMIGVISDHYVQRCEREHQDCNEAKCKDCGRELRPTNAHIPYRCALCNLATSYRGSEGEEGYQDQIEGILIYCLSLRQTRPQHIPFLPKRTYEVTWHMVSSISNIKPGHRLQNSHMAETQWCFDVRMSNALVLRS